MKASFIALVASAAAVSAQNGTVPWTTSTITQSKVYTITSCAPTVTDCPAKMGSVTTEVWTTVTYCPVTGGSTTVAPPPVSTPAPTGPSTKTIYSTTSYTITSCPPTVTNCPVGSVTSSVLTSTVTIPSSKTTGIVIPPPVTVVVPPKSSGVVTIPPPVSTNSGVVSTLTISTCVPSYITSVITVYPSSTPVGTPTGVVCPGCPSTGTTVTKSYGTAAPSGYKPASNTTVPFTGAASSQKVGGFLFVAGLAAAALF